MNYRISVVNLVNFACRTGDLEFHSTHGPSAREGIKAHKKIQQDRPQTSKAEVSIKTTLEFGSDTLTLSGRMDLLHLAEVPHCIQEIKTTLVPPSYIAQSNVEAHWAQLKVYGYCYLLQNRSDPLDSVSGDEVQLSLLWLNLLDQTKISEVIRVTYTELEKFTYAAAERYFRWIKKVEAQLDRTRESARTLDFPYGEFRAGQRDMAAATYRIARDSGCLLCEAPTGVGKTISTLFPVVKAIADGHVNKTAYLTAKTSGRIAALNAIDDMRRAGLEVSSLVLQSKVLICPCSNGSIDRDEQGRCAYTLGFFDRLPSARDELMDRVSIDAETLTQIATKYQICPFELSLQMLPWMTIVICDYNYVFDPLVRLTAFSEPDKKLILLLDESHNLIDRARNMYSARLSRMQNQSVLQQCRDSHPGVARALTSLSRAMDRWAKQEELNEWTEKEASATITRAVIRCVEALSTESADAAALPEGGFEWYKELYRYLAIEDLYTEQHYTVTRTWRQGKRREVEIQLRCVNARKLLQKSFSLFKAVVAFSATLRPLEYYNHGLGVPEHTQGMVLPSPFDPKRLGIFVCPFIDARYRQRTLSIDALVELIYRVFTSRRGNYLVFFPSYQYLAQVSSVFAATYPGTDIVVQERNSDAQSREVFLKQFVSGGAVLGFAIVGGTFGEGIDYEGERLIGALIVGTALPTLNLEQKLIADDYTNNGLDGFNFAYRYPGFTRVLQTAGRVIRGEKDKGVVILADTRFQENFYRSLYPLHWQVTHCTSQARLTDALHEFWTEQQRSEFTQ